jgi:hypothetical protein
MRVMTSVLTGEGYPVWELDGDPIASSLGVVLVTRGLGVASAHLTLEAMRELATALDGFLDLVDEAETRGRL